MFVFVCTHINDGLVAHGPWAVVAVAPYTCFVFRRGIGSICDGSFRAKPCSNDDRDDRSRINGQTNEMGGWRTPDNATLIRCRIIPS